MRQFKFYIRQTYYRLFFSVGTDVQLTYLFSAMRSVARIGGKSMAMTPVQTLGGFALGTRLSMTTTTSMPKRIHQISVKSGT